MARRLGRPAPRCGLPGGRAGHLAGRWYLGGWGAGGRAAIFGPGSRFLDPWR